jgi:ketosteroid isomerase-like protein
LLTEDHRFLDSLGVEIVGRDRMRPAWEDYFAMFPDYRMEVTEVLVSEPNVALFGATSATYFSRS